MRYKSRDLEYVPNIGADTYANQIFYFMIALLKQILDTVMRWDANTLHQGY